MDSIANGSPEIIDYTSGTVMGTHVTVLTFMVSRKERRAVWQAVDALTNIHISEHRTFRHSTFILSDYETPATQQSALKQIMERFEAIAVPRW